MRLHVSEVDTTRLRVLLRDGGVDPSALTDEEVKASYIKRFGAWLFAGYQTLEGR